MASSPSSRELRAIAASEEDLDALGPAAVRPTVLVTQHEEPSHRKSPMDTAPKTTPLSDVSADIDSNDASVGVTSPSRSSSLTPDDPRLHGLSRDTLVANNAAAARGAGMVTSTPLSDQRSSGHLDDNRASLPLPLATPGCSRVTEEEDLHEKFEVPILGYEVMEERARFTVFKIHVKRKDDCDGWFIFRRYSDFDRLNNKLKEIFPIFRLALPPKKWFGDNYDKNFLEDRILGLQAFLNNVVGHPDVCNSEPVREFFCFDEPPGPHDSLEESRALCELMEEQMFLMRQEVQERGVRIALLEEELQLCRTESENLRRSLRVECTLYSQSLDKQDKPHSVHTDHVINLVLLNLIERSMNRARRHSLPRSEMSLPLVEHDHVVEDTGVSQDASTSSKSSALTSPDEVPSGAGGALSPEKIRLNRLPPAKLKAGTAAADVSAVSRRDSGLKSVPYGDSQSYRPPVNDACWGGGGREEPDPVCDNKPRVNPVQTSAPRMNGLGPQKRHNTVTMVTDNGVSNVTESVAAGERTAKVDRNANSPIRSRAQGEPACSS